MTYKRRFFLVNDIERRQEPRLVPIEGSSRFHCIRNTGVEGVIDTRVSSCSCRGCGLGDVHTPGPVEVDQFQRESCVKKSKEDLQFSSAVWGDASVNKNPAPKKKGSKLKSGTPLESTPSIPKEPVPQVPQTVRGASPKRHRDNQRDPPVTPEEDLQIDGRSEHFPGWKSVANALAKCSTITELKKYVNELGSVPGLPANILDQNLDVDIVDRIACRVIPSDVKDDSADTLMAVQVLPDGNCLPRSLSRIVYGHSALHIEMRCRLTLELAGNIYQYINEHNLRKGANFDAEMEVCTYYVSKSKFFKANNPGDEYRIAVARSVLEKEIMASVKSGKDCGEAREYTFLVTIMSFYY